MNNVLILGKNISLSLLIGIVHNSSKENITTVCCTVMQIKLLYTLGLPKDVKHQVITNVKLLNDSIDHGNDLKNVKNRLLAALNNNGNIYLAGEVNHLWLIAAAQLGNFTVWRKEHNPTLNDLLICYSMKRKELNPDKQLGSNHPNQFLITHNGRKIFQIIPEYFAAVKGSLAIVKSEDYAFGINFIATALKENFISRVIVTAPESSVKELSKWIWHTPSNFCFSTGYDLTDPSYTSNILHRIQIETIENVEKMFQTTY